MLILAALIGGTFFVFRKANIPYDLIEIKETELTPDSLLYRDFPMELKINKTESNLEMNVSFPIYYIGFITFLGWYSFVKI